MTLLDADLQAAETKPLKNGRKYHVAPSSRIDAAREMGVSMQVLCGRWINPRPLGASIQSPSQLPGQKVVCQSCRKAMERLTQTKPA